ncbi:MAG TPA: sodium:solute symporter family protein [archaeon]|nr:sodium:solute symporter family protein [archaeon]
MFTTALAVVIYLLVIGYLGFLGYKKTATATDYLIAGRQIHPYVMAISYGATFISTSAIVGFGGVAGLFGMGLLWLTFLNIFVGIFIAFVFFGNRTRVMGYHLDAHTFPEFLGKRYGSKFIQVFAGAVIFIAMPLYAGVVLIGGARFIETNMGIPYLAALLIFTVIIAAYVIAGGLKGVMYTDALQGSIMFVGMLILFIFTYVSLGGFTGAHQALTDLADKVPESLAKAGHVGWTAMPTSFSGWWWTLVSTIVLGVGIGVLAQPQLVVRFMTVKSRKELSRAVLVGGIFIFMMTGVAFIVGSLTNVFFFKTKGVISVAAAGGNVDTIIPLYITEALPKWFGLVFMLTLLAAAMSTLSSQFHVMGTAISRDIYQQVTKKTEKDRTIMLTRLGIMVGIVIVMWLGWVLPESIIAPGTAIFFGLCASSFLPMYALGLYWKRVTPAAAISGLVFGFVGSVLYLLFIHSKESAALGICNFMFGKPTLASFPWVVVDPIAVIFPLTAIITLVVSLFTKPCDEEIIKSCFRK